MKFLVLGSNCFSAANFVDHVLEKGNEVLGISRSEQPHPVFLPYAKRQSPSFTFHALDLNHDVEPIMDLVNEFKPDYVLNYAAQGMVAESWGHPEQWYMTNIVSPVKLHDRLKDCSFLKKFIQISTPEVYGNCEGDVKESIQYCPSTPYAVSKAAIDMSLMSYHKAYNFPVSFTRAANVYGEGQQLYRIIPRTILYFLIGKKLQLHGGGHSVRSFIHIDDVSEATYKIALSEKSGEIYHLSTDERVSIRQLVELIASKMNMNFDDHVEVSEDRLAKDSAYLLNSEKARQELDWKPSVSLEKGVDDTIKWIEKNLAVLKEQPLNYIHKK